MGNVPRDHHVVPQFFLRNFAVDEARTKVTTVAKEGRFAVWMERSIKGLGFERDFYVHLEGGRPVSVETTIGSAVETPISRSDTWAKIAAGRSDALDRSDKPVLYSLVRHLEARSPHFRDTAERLAAMARDPSSEARLTPEERDMYAFLQGRPALRKLIYNAMATDPYDARAYDGSLVMVHRSPVPLRTSTTPAIAANAPPHPGMALPSPDAAPFQLVLAVDPHTMVSVVTGDLGGEFVNAPMGEDVALGLNRITLAHFARFPSVRHLVTGRDRLVEDMTWAPYEKVSEAPGKAVFRRW